MLAYWLLFLVFAAGSLWYSSAAQGVPATTDEGAAGAPKRFHRVIPGNRLLNVAAIATALMIGLRYEVGADWENYLDIYRRIRPAEFEQALSIADPGYGFLNWFSARIGWEIWLVNLVCALLLVFGVVRFAKIQAEPWLAVAAAVPYLLIVVGMGYTRQAVAIGLCMAGLVAVSKGSLGRFVLWVLAGALFHRTAVILIPLVGIAYTRNRLQALAFGIVGGIAGYYLLTSGAGAEHFKRLYVERSLESQGAVVRLAMNVPPALLYLFNSRRFASDDTERSVWRSFAIVALASLAALGLTNSTTALDRLGLYIIPLQIVVLSRLPAAFALHGRQSRLLTIFTLLYLAAIQFVWLNFAANAVAWIPYQAFGL
jgi:hypothetical protein